MKVTTLNGFFKAINGRTARALKPRECPPAGLDAQAFDLEDGFTLILDINQDGGLTIFTVNDDSEWAQITLSVTDVDQG